MAIPEQSDSIRCESDPAVVVIPQTTRPPFMREALGYNPPMARPSPQLQPLADKSMAFIIPGAGLAHAAKSLKVAFPKRKQAPTTVVQFKVSHDSVTVALAGAEVIIPGVATGGFSVELPWAQFAQVLQDDYLPRALLHFEFSPGTMTVQGITVSLPEIKVKRIGSRSRVPAPSPADSPLGLPLLGVYDHIRQYGPLGAPDDVRLLEQQDQIKNIFRRADKLLEPLGITGDDLRRMLDERLGVTGSDEG